MKMNGQSQKAQFHVNQSQLKNICPKKFLIELFGQIQIPKPI